jgi:hypothetical protein
VRRYFVIALLLSTAGCAVQTNDTGDLINLSLGMDQSEVEEEVGPPSAVRSAMTNKYGQTIHVWEYRLGPKTHALQDFLAGPVGRQELARVRRDYWLYFVDDTLIRWGEAGDWQQTADHLYDIRFGTDGALP